MVSDKRSKRDGRIVERVGHYNPLVDPIQYKIKEARALYWLSVGAQASEAVGRLLEKQGTFARLERLRAGESIETLVAEFEGVDVAAAAVDKAVVAEIEAVVAADEEE